MSKFHQGRFTPRHPHKYIGNPANIIFRSSWEFTFLQWLDTNPNVLRYASEELHLPYFYPIDKKWHKYFPDFIVELRTRDDVRQTWMVEIKPHNKTLPPTTRRYKNPRTQLREHQEYTKNVAKWNAAKAFCNTKGWRFVVITEKTLYPSPT